MANKQNLKAYARRDAAGAIVVGSVVWRLKKPKFGNYFELSQAYECCTTTSTTTATP